MPLKIALRAMAWPESSIPTESRTCIGYACIYKGLGLTVKKEFDGVYYIEGFLIPAQIVVTRELESGKHSRLKVLSRNPLEEDVLGFFEDAHRLTEQGDRPNMESHAIKNHASREGMACVLDSCGIKDL